MNAFKITIGCLVLLAVISILLARGTRSETPADKSEWDYAKFEFDGPRKCVSVVVERLIDDKYNKLNSAGAKPICQG